MAKRRIRRIAAFILLVLLGLVALLFLLPTFPAPILIPAKMLLGEGGVMHHVGNVNGSLNGTAVSYNVYCGKAKHANGWPITCLLLRAGKPATTNWEDRIFDALLVGRDEIRFPYGLEVIRLPQGYLPVVCTSSILPEKWLLCPTLVSSANGTNRFTLAFSSDGGPTNDSLFRLEVPVVLLDLAESYNAQ